MKIWFLSDKIKIWNDNINNWLEKHPINKIYHELVLKTINN